MKGFSFSSTDFQFEGYNVNEIALEKIIKKTLGALFFNARQLNWLIRHRCSSAVARDREEKDITVKRLHISVKQSINYHNVL